MASCSFSGDQAIRRLRATAAAAASAAALAAVATTPLLSSGTSTALIGNGSSCPGAMWLSNATGSWSDSESEEDLPVGDEVCKRGYLRKQKHGHRRYFVLKLETADAPARLEYYENARKFRHSVRAAAAAAAAAASGTAVPALIPPRRVIILDQCFSVTQRADARYRHLIALFTQNEYFAMVAENESEQESWYLLLSRLILESKRRRCGTLGAQPEGEPAALAEAAEAAVAEPPFYKDVWQVIVKPRGLGHRKELSGVFRLCLTDEEVIFVRLNTEVASLAIQLLSIRRCGHSEQYFFLEVGRSTVIGPGELWMQVDDCVVAQNMHELFLEKMRALRADDYRVRCRSYSVNIGAHLLNLLSARRHLGLLPLESGGWLRRSFERLCHLRAIGDGEDEMLLTRRFTTSSEPLPPSRSERLHLPRPLRSRRAISVPASFLHRLTPSLVCSPHPEESPKDGASAASGSSPDNARAKGKEGKESQEGSEGDYMPMNNWGSGNGPGTGGGQGSSGQGSSSQSSSGRQGSEGGQDSSGGQGSGGQSSGGQGAGGNQAPGDGHGTTGSHGSGDGQGPGDGHGSGSSWGPGDGHSGSGGKNSGGNKGSGSGKSTDGDGDHGKSLKKKSYFGKLIEGKQQQMGPPPSPPPAGPTNGKEKSGERFRLYFCADEGATKEQKDAKEMRDKETLVSAARDSHRARAFDEDEDDPYVPMRPGVTAPLTSSSDYLPMAPQNVSASKKQHSRSPFEDSSGYMMFRPLPTQSAPKTLDPNKEDDSKDNNSDNDYRLMAARTGAIPKKPRNPQGDSSKSSSTYSLPIPFQSSPLGQSDHSEYVPMLPGKFLGWGKEVSSDWGLKDRASKPILEGSFSESGDGGSPLKPSDDGSPKNKVERPNQQPFITKGNKIMPKPQKQREVDSSSEYVNIDLTKSDSMPAPSAQGLPHSLGIIADPSQPTFSNYVNAEFRLPFPNPASSLSNLSRATPDASPLSLDGARRPLPPLPPRATGGNVNVEKSDHSGVIFNRGMTPVLRFADSAIRYDAETGQIYVVDPFSECGCMDISLSPSRCSEPPLVARMLQEEQQETRGSQSPVQSFFAASRAAVSAFPTDSLQREISASLSSAAASAAAPTLEVGELLAAASARAKVPGLNAPAPGLEAAIGFDCASASAGSFQPVANASNTEAVREAQDNACSSNSRAPNIAAHLARGESAAGADAAAAEAPPLPPRNRGMPRPLEREDDDVDTDVRVNFARPHKKFSSPKRE